MKHSTVRRWLAFLLSAVLLASLLPALSLTAGARDPKKVNASSADELKTYLESSTDYDITLTKSIDKYIDSTDVYQGFYTKEFNYNARLSQGQSTYHCTPTFQVWQDGREDGLFGDNKVDYFNPLTAKDEKVEAIKNGAYVFTYPLFEQNRGYKFKLKAYEQYTNSDDENNVVTTTVPLKNAIVTIDNQMSADRRVAAEAGMMGGVEYRPGDVIDDTALAQYVDVADNQLLLDEKGEATYTWSAGFPNIYDDLTRSLSISSPSISKMTA